MTDIEERTSEPIPPVSTSAGTAGKTKDRRSDFVFSLLRLASANDPTRTDRQALAELRGVLRGTPADLYRAARYVTPYLGERESPNDRWFYLTGGLLALHPKHERGVTPGKAFGELRGDSGSMDSRFLALLNAPVDSLPKVLRQMVALLQARGIGLDYLWLLHDLCDWDDADHAVQKRWARDYFRTNADQEKSTDPDAEASAENATTMGDSDE